MQVRKTILIFGVSSFVGSNLAEVLKDKYRVVGTYHSQRVQIPDVLCIPCDIFNRDAIQMMLFIFRPDVTIYCPGLSSVLDCAEKEKLADSLNNAAIFNVIQFAERYKSKIIYLSSGFVFSGEKPIYMEGDTPDPNTVYGKTKASGEFFIQKSCMNYLIFRICNLYGRSYNPRQKTIFETIEKKFQDKSIIRLDDQVKMGFLDVHYVAHLIDISIEHDVSNKLLHVCSKDISTYYDFGVLYAEIFKKNKDRIHRSRWPLPLDRMIDNEDAIENGLRFRLDINNLENYMVLEVPTIKESLEETFSRFGGNHGQKKSGRSTGSIDFI